MGTTVLFDILVDNTTYHGNGQTAVGHDVFQHLTFGINNLTSGLHDITITNKGYANGTAAYFDVDFVIWEGSVPDNSNTLTVTSTNTTGFEYLPAGDWTPSDDSNSYSGKLYSTDNPAAELRLNFTGQSIALYGSLDSDHGNFSCSIDGISLGDVSGNYDDPVEQQLLCFGDNLNNNTHVLTVKNHLISSGKAQLSVDYAEIHGSPAALVVQVQKHTTGRTNVAVIAGGVVGGIGALFILIALLFFCVSRRQRQKQDFGSNRESRSTTYPNAFDIEPRPPMMQEQGYGPSHSPVMPFPHYAGSYTNSDRHLSFPSDSFYGYDRSGNTGGPEVRLSGTASTLTPNDSQSQTGLIPSHSRGHSQSSRLSTPTVSDNDRKSRYRPISSAALRYRAPEHEQDAGPVSFAENDEDAEESRAVGGPTLPPVYSSITTPSSGHPPLPPPATAAADDDRISSRRALPTVPPRDGAEDR